MIAASAAVHVVPSRSSAASSRIWLAIWSRSEDEATSFCATSWRYVRAKCVHCGSTEKVSFRQLSGTSFVRAECCESCKGYSKVFYVEKVKPVEPMADDLASLGLDVLIGEEGYARAPNPFVLGIMERPEG